MNKWKMALALLLAVATLALSGCNLIDTDEVEVIRQERAAVEKDFATVLAEYDGGTVTKEQALYPFYSQYSWYYQLYSQFGMSLDSAMIDDIAKTSVESEVLTHATDLEFERRGLELPESEEEILAEADEQYAAAYDGAYSSAEGKTDEVKAANAEFMLYQQGITQNRVREYALSMHRQEALREAVENEIESLTDEEMQAAYDKRVSENESTYTATPAQFGRDMTNGTTAICWAPEGYRTVKHVLVIPEDEVLSRVTDARDALSDAQAELDNLETELEQATGENAETEAIRTADEIQADIDAKQAEMATLEQEVKDAEDACLLSVEDRVNEVYAALESGRTFDDVMAEYGEDPGMKSEPAMTVGYYVCADSTQWDANFTAGSMALAKVGDVSETPVISTSGVHIIYYASDVTPGPIPMEQVHDQLYTEALDDAKTEHYEQEETSWVEALHPVYHLENWEL